jgi:hypothetical protein
MTRHSRKLSRAAALVASYAMSTRPIFDYDALPADLAESTRAAAQRIKSCTRASIIEIGRELLAVKKALAHGEFGAWLESEFGMTSRSAQRYMSAALAFGDKYDTVSFLPPTTLYRLAAASAPVRDEIVRRFETGERLPGSVVEEIVKRDRARERAHFKRLIRSEGERPQMWVVEDELRACRPDLADEVAERIAAEDATALRKARAEAAAHEAVTLLKRRLGAADLNRLAVLLKEAGRQLEKAIEAAIEHRNAVQSAAELAESRVPALPPSANLPLSVPVAA